MTGMTDPKDPGGFAVALAPNEALALVGYAPR
jgi:hypothetical protein